MRVPGTLIKTGDLVGSPTASGPSGVAGKPQPKGRPAQVLSSLELHLESHLGAPLGCWGGGLGGVPEVRKAVTVLQNQRSEYLEFRGEIT